MEPGGACVACHDWGEGPAFRFAGTVFSKQNEADQCTGLAGAKVEITDANGQILFLTSNSTGNFYTSGRGVTVATPYRAKLVYAGGEKPMSSSQTDGDCNACHTAAGLNGAPGRIWAP